MSLSPRVCIKTLSLAPVSSLSRSIRLHTKREAGKPVTSNMKCIHIATPHLILLFFLPVSRRPGLVNKWPTLLFHHVCLSVFVLALLVFFFFLLFVYLFLLLTIPTTPSSPRPPSACTHTSAEALEFSINSMSVCSDAYKRNHCCFAAARLAHVSFSFNRGDGVNFSGLKSLADH